MKVGDLVKMPTGTTYWWSGKIGIIDYYGIANPLDHENSYRVFIPPNMYARFSDPDFVEVISESR